MKKQGKHYFTSFLSFFQISAEETGSSRRKKNAFFSALEETGEPCVALQLAQSPYPIYRHGKACLSKQPPWLAAGDPRLARSRSRVRAPGPEGTLHALFSLHPPFLPPSGDSFFRTFPTKPMKVLGL